MEPEFIEFIRNARKRKVEKFRTQLSVFLICMGISVFLWTLVHLSKDYFYTAEYHLNYKQVPWNMKMLSCSDSTLILTIRLQGYEFFSEQFFRGKKRACDVSLRGMKMRIGEDEVNGYLLTRGIAKNITEQSNYPLEVFSTSPDTIYFTFERRSIKHMSVGRAAPLRMIHAGKDSVPDHPDSIRGNVYPSEIKTHNTTKKKR